MGILSSTIWPDIKAKLMSLVFVREDGCWAYTGGLTTHGYGHLNWDGKVHKAHVISYLVHKGPIPEGQWVLHTCDQPWCVNPDHLWPGTVQDNVDDMIRKGRKARSSGGSALRDDDVRQIRRLLAEGQHSQTEIGEMFRINRATVSDIKRGRSWAWLE
jgi:hypothetical protein